MTGARAAQCQFCGKRISKGQEYKLVRTRKVVYWAVGARTLTRDGRFHVRCASFIEACLKDRGNADGKLAPYAYNDKSAHDCVLKRIKADCLMCDNRWICNKTENDMLKCNELNKYGEPIG
ncbi:MAG: hypothetical protein LUE27_06885 [Clostridia bacterium]|nr:hypothetical protein [Clostridia bacterium]